MTLRVLLAVSAAALLAAAAPPKGKAPHPDVGAANQADACTVCHGVKNPDVVNQWEASSHGLNLVKCFVCHGSTGRDFARRPTAARCEGCHADKATAVVPAAKGRSKACFDCHAPHGLGVAAGQPNPHAKQ
jgi:hypothetical protein